MTFNDGTTAVMVMEAAKSVVTNPDLELAWAKGKASEWGGQGSGQVDAFLNTPATKEAKGHVKGILILYEVGTDPEDADDTQKISFDFKRARTDQTIEEAYEAVYDAMGGENAFAVAPSDTAPTEEEIKAAVEAHLAAYDDGVGAVIAGSGITAEVTIEILKDPTVAEEGYVKIAISLSKEGSDEEPWEYLTQRRTPILLQSFAQARAAVEALEQRRLVDNSANVTESQRQNAQNYIVSLARDAVNQEQYTVSLKEELVVIESTVVAKGSGTMTLTIKENSSGREEDITLTWVIPMLRARFGCSCGNFVTYDYEELKSHLAAHVLNGEAEHYGINYEYIEEE
jgi:hypothetical protein